MIDKSTITDITDADPLRGRVESDIRDHWEKINGPLNKEIIKHLVKEDIIKSKGNEKIRIRIRSYPEYTFVFGDNSQIGEGAGKDDGDADGDPGKSDNSDKKGGDAPPLGPGETEVEISLDEALERALGILSLPDLEEKIHKEAIKETRRVTKGYKKHGMQRHLSVRRTMRNLNRVRIAYRGDMEIELTPAEYEALTEEQKRFYRFDAASNSYRFREIYVGDAERYRRKEFQTEEITSAVLVLIRDFSGSMGEKERMLVRVLFMLVLRALRREYPDIVVRFIGHTVEAWEITSEQEFINGTGGGGTVMSSASEIVESWLKDPQSGCHPDMTNIFVFQATDGENASEDNGKFINLTETIVALINLYGFVEVMPGQQATQQPRSDTARALLAKLSSGSNAKKFSWATITSPDDIVGGVKRLFGIKKGDK